MSERCGKYTYKKEEKFGSGEYGCVYLARKEEEKEGEKKLYVIKFPLWEKMDDDRKKTFKNEVKILDKLSKIPDNKYTSIIYDSNVLPETKKEDKKIEDKKVEENKIEENKIEENKIEEQKQNKENEKTNSSEKPYYVMDYFSRGLLVDYAGSGKLTEIQIKYIFKKVIESYKFLHEKCGILHLDIKFDNIMMDKDFNAIIIDFGFSKAYKDEKGNINPQIGSGGSKEFAAPELYKGKELTDEKADIFSLGVILFALVTRKYGFGCSRNNDPFYKLIRKNKYKLYWDCMKKFKKIEGLSEEFINLYLAMVSHKPKKRPTFEEILNHPFLKEVNNLTKEQEIQIKKELEDLYNNHIKKVVKVYKSNDDIINNEHLITRAGESKGDVIFENKKLEPKKISKDRLFLNQAIEIDGNIS